MIKPGTQLEQLCARGRREALFVAPFIKAGALERLLTNVNSDIVVRCVTRWQPEEIAAGVSDIEVWSVLCKRPQASLWLRADLHAKYYRVDDQCLIGSANLTAAALGWSMQSNLELLVQLSVADTVAVTFEAELWKNCVPVTNAIFQQTMVAVDFMRQVSPNILTERSDAVQGTPFLPLEERVFNEMWLPTLRNPSDLYLLYTDRDDELTMAAREAATADLYALPVPPGLPRDAFTAYVGVLLLQKPVVQRVDEFLAVPQRFGAVRDFLKTLPVADEANFNAERAWQTLMRWLFYFLPTRYVMKPSRRSEVVWRVDQS